MQKFVTHLDSVQGKSKNTVNSYLSDLRLFFSYILDSKKLNEDTEIDINLIKTITIDDIYAFLSYINRERGNGPHARARKIASIRKFYSFLSEVLEVIPDNIAKKLAVPKTPKKLPVYLTLDQAEDLLKNPTLRQNTRDYFILTLFMNCGMRLSELCGINIGDIKGDTIVITGKGNKQRTVYLNTACISAYRNYLMDREKISTEEKALFLNKNGGRLGQRGVENIVKKAFMLAGIDSTVYSTHKLRHTAATLMYQYGNVDVRALQDILGHEHLSTTEIYTHIDEARLREAVEENPLSAIDS